MDRADKTAAQAGMPHNLVAAADFAVCAFIDEALLSSVPWRGQMDWLKNPLQLARYGKATAGEDFYRLLDALLKKAEEEDPAAAPPQARNPDGTMAVWETGVSDPLRAALEIFALCLAQGFAGMLYGNPKTIRDRLDQIGRFVPSVARRDGPLFLEPGRVRGRGPLRRMADLIRRFDPLDWVLWIVPPLLTALLYSVCAMRLDQLLQPLLQGISPL
jgi:type VI protein secretion system component VasF